MYKSTVLTENSRSVTSKERTFFMGNVLQIKGIYAKIRAEHISGRSDIYAGLLRLPQVRAYDNAGR